MNNDEKEIKKEELSEAETENVSGGINYTKKPAQALTMPPRLQKELDAAKNPNYTTPKRCKVEGCTYPVYPSGKNPECCFIHQDVK